MMTRPTRIQAGRTGGFRRQAGVSLIEALIALAIMAIGMLGIVGVQATLRSSSDVAKQRSEAVRIAQREIEQWRGFMRYSGGAGTRYDDLPVGTVTDPDITGINATYTPTRTVVELPDPRRGKTLTVTIAWTDRAGQAQSVQMSTLIARISPELALSMAVPGGGDAVQRVNGRNSGIPLGAKDLGGGKSGWIPPGSPTGTAWIFDNISGVMTLCSTTATTTATLVYDANNPASGNVTCTGDKAIYIGGFLRYALGVNQPTPADATNPPSAPSDSPAQNAVTVSVNYTYSGGPATTACYVVHYTSPSIFLPSYSQYHCAVQVLLVVPGVPLSWTGELEFGPPSGYFATSAAETAANLMKVCRYPTSGSFNTVTGQYLLQTAPLQNQNHLLIRAGDGGTTSPVSYTCPAGTALQQP
jgi:type II secretory pathway pseudopilin PulG